MGGFPDIEESGFSWDHRGAALVSTSIILKEHSDEVASRRYSSDFFPTWNSIGMFIPTLLADSLIRSSSSIVMPGL